MDPPRVGASAVIVRDGAVLLGLRRGAHGAGTWGFPGGKVDPGEHPRDTVARELHEETGLVATSVEPIAWTNDVFAEGLHYVTLHHPVQAAGDPEITEPDKVDAWRWWSWHALPRPLFLPASQLAASGWQPQ